MIDSSSDQITLRSKDESEIVTKISKFVEKYPESFIKVIQDSDSSEITLELPLPSKIVNILIRYVQTRDIYLNSVEDAFLIKDLTKGCELEEIEKKCRNFISDRINPHNVCSIYHVATLQIDTVLQYCCWKTFDTDWKEIFSGEQFLHCEEAIIFLYLRRPIYESLSEENLFSSVYDWCKTKSRQRLQQPSSSKTDLTQRNESHDIRCAMEPFISFIRFLAMEQEYLEQHVFKLNILTEEEIEGIRRYLIMNKDKTHLPGTLCKIELKRTEVVYHTLFEYKNHKKLGYEKNRRLKSFHEFLCHIFVKEDCFLTEIDMPISNSSNKDLTINITGKNIIQNENLEERSDICNKAGKIELREPLFLKMGMEYQLQVKFANEDVEQNVIYINADSESFITDAEYNRLQKKTIPQKRKYWSYNYFTVTLYF